MFKTDVYINRRKILKEKMSSGIVLFLGNSDSPMNYEDNIYKFHQDSTFLYYFGLSLPGLAAVINIDTGEEIIFGNDFTIDDMVWMGPQKPLSELGEKIGVNNFNPLEKLQPMIQNAISGGQKIHFLPQYRDFNKIWLEELTSIKISNLTKNVSIELINTVIEQRAIKSDEEISEIESALSVTHEMYTTAMKMIKPGMYEREIAGYIEGIALSKGSGVSFPIIFSVHGETLHNHHHDNLMADGDIAVLDSGAESLSFYASDITRTIPVNGKFSEQQKVIYNSVLTAQLDAINASKPGVLNKEIHLLAAKRISQGLKSAGIMKGNIDEAVSKGAHALFFPHGLGHMMGLDVHDMENLGENLVGYNDEVKRSDQFGLAYLRLGKELKKGNVITVEPGCYFIPQLIDKWKSEKKFEEFINYDEVEKYKSFGGVRIEDDILITETGSRVLGENKIPKTVAEVEEACR